MNKVEWLNRIEEIIAKGPFAPSMRSLKSYQVPAWYEDGKFGIFIHWGPYSVPAFDNEWYPRNMYQPGTKAFEHHIATYGPHKHFGYKDFIPLMTAECFDPCGWASLFSRSGARFVVPVAEHHDGFQMYNSALSRWNAFQMGPKRDVLGELRAALLDQGLVFGASSHRAEHYWFMDGVHKFDSDYTPQLEDLYGPAQPAPQNPSSLTDGPPTAEHLDDWLIRTCELVDIYRPQLLWFDWWINHMAFRPYLEKFAAYYYNRAAEWGLGVAINHKFSAYDEGCAVFDVERGQLSDSSERFWQNDTSVSKNSWGFVQGHEYKRSLDLLCDLCDIVSKNGALLLNIGPRADGSIPQEEQNILLAIGRWLSHNGESIYGTRPWRQYGEGPTAVPAGSFTDTKRSLFTGKDIRYTTGGGCLFANVLGLPEQDSLLLTAVSQQDNYTIAERMDGTPLESQMNQAGLHIRLDRPLREEDLPLTIRLRKG